MASINCAGPQPLSVAIDPQDEQAYGAALVAARRSPRNAYARWMAHERGLTPDAVLHADSAVSTIRNPFDARRDRRAVSRGAVLFKNHCADCHGDDAGGGGPFEVADHPAASFRSFKKRVAITLFGGNPRGWFQDIRNGKGPQVEYTGGTTSAMPSFGEELTREQTWLVITYLQSLDIHGSKESD